MACRLFGAKPLSETILLIQSLGTNFSKILSKIHTFPFKKIHLKMSSAKWQQFCLGLNMLNNKMVHNGMHHIFLMVQRYNIHILNWGFCIVFHSNNIIKFCYFTEVFLLYLNSLLPNDAIWQHGSRSTMVQVMACCLTAPSHYLNQSWLINTKVQWCSSEGNFAWDITATSY